MNRGVEMESTETCDFVIIWYSRRLKVSNHSLETSPFVRTARLAVISERRKYVCRRGGGD